MTVLICSLVGGREDKAMMLDWMAHNRMLGSAMSVIPEWNFQ